MAKKKKATITTDRALGNVQSIFHNYLKSNSYIPKEESAEIKFQSTGYPTLDLILGGGVALGMVSQFVGRTGSGKSALVGNILGNIQRSLEGKCYIGYFDSEQTTTEYRLEQLGFINTDNVLVNDFTLEEFFKAIEGIILFKKDNPEHMDLPCFFVLDSLATTKVEKVKEVDDPNQVTGLKARILSFYFEKYLSEFKKYNITIFIINQKRAKIQMGMFPKPGEMKALGTDENIPGGKALKHATFHMYAVHDAKSLKEEVFGFRGNEVRIEMIKCKSFTPYIPISVYFNFVSGFNRLWSLYGALKDAKLIQMKGGWAVLEGWEKDGKQRKFRQSQLEDHYAENKDGFADCFDNAVSKYRKDFTAQYRDAFMAQKHLKNIVTGEGDEVPIEEQDGSKPKLKPGESVDNGIDLDLGDIG